MPWMTSWKVQKIPRSSRPRLKHGKEVISVPDLLEFADLSNNRPGASSDVTFVSTESSEVSDRLGWAAFIDGFRGKILHVPQATCVVPSFTSQKRPQTRYGVWPQNQLQQLALPPIACSAFAASPALSLGLARFGFRPLPPAATPTFFLNRVVVILLLESSCFGCCQRESCS